MSESSRDQERWLPVLEYEGRYEVSDHGRVRSLDRTALKRSGVKQFHRGRIRKPNHHRAGHPFVSLSGHEKKKNRFVHRLVLEAFVGPRPEGLEGCHNDGSPQNNHLSNLRTAVVVAA